MARIPTSPPPVPVQELFFGLTWAHKPQIPFLDLTLLYLDLNNFPATPLFIILHMKPFEREIACKKDTFSRKFYANFYFKLAVKTNHYIICVTLAKLVHLVYIRS